MNKTSILKITLWSAKILLPLTLLWAGAMKLFKPSDLPWAWIKENPNLVTITGIFDLLAAIGLVLPTLLNIQPKLSKFASYGIILLMLSAIVFHISRGEGSQIGFNILVILLASLIAWKDR